MKPKKSKTVITPAVKIKNEVIQVDKGSLPKKMIINIPKSEINSTNVYSLINLGLMVALRDLGIDNIDTSIREKNGAIEILVEK